MSYSFHPEAEAEFIRAIEYYEEKEVGLGHDFAVEVYSTIERSVAFPEAWPVIEQDIRRSLVRRFPYGILYLEQEKEIYILAVMHLHRDPEYWKHRTQEMG
jgi:plasmid stabilization system protein ParE